MYYLHWAYFKDKKYFKSFEHIFICTACVSLEENLRHTHFIEENLQPWILHKVPVSESLQSVIVFNGKSKNFTYYGKFLSQYLSILLRNLMI